MNTWEYVGLFGFLIVVVLLFFAAFGGSNLTEQSVEEYMQRLLRDNHEEKKQYGIKAEVQCMWRVHDSTQTTGVLPRFGLKGKVVGMS